MAATTHIESLHPDIITAFLRHMDGPTLAAFSSTTSLLRHLSSEPSLWAHLSLATWPSLSHLHSLDHRRLFSDSFPFPATVDTVNQYHVLPTRLVSAIDLYHKDTLIFSRVVDTNATSSWFLDSPFRVDALDRKDPDHRSTDQQAANPAELKLSWVVMDPESRRAVNVSSRRPVVAERQWYTGETAVRFAVVVGGCAVMGVVTCAEEDGHVREVSLTVEDVDGRAVSGRESLGVLKAAMEGERRGVKWGERIVQENYDEFLRERMERRERRLRREWLVDSCCTGFVLLMFFSFVMMLAFR